MSASKNQIPGKSNQTTVNGLGFLGILLFFIAVLLLFVVVVEYDPVAHQIKHQGQTVKAVVLAKSRVRHDSLFGDYLPYRYRLQVTIVKNQNQSRTQSEATRVDQGIWTLGYLSEWQWQRIQSGQKIKVRQDTIDQTRLIVSQAMPSVPRDPSHFIFPIILMLIAAVLVVFDPAILYKAALK